GVWDIRSGVWHPTARNRSGLLAEASRLSNRGVDEGDAGAVMTRSQAVRGEGAAGQWGGPFSGHFERPIWGGKRELPISRSWWSGGSHLAGRPSYVVSIYRLGWKQPK